MERLLQSARNSGFDGKSNVLIKLRHSREDDFGRVMDFYRKNPDLDVHPRQEDVMHERISGGNFILIEREGELHGAGGVYDLGGDDLQCLEFGTGRLVGVNGYGLYPLLLSAHVMNAVLQDYPVDCVVQSTTASAPRVNQIVKGHGGWEHLQWPETIKEAIKSTKPDAHNVNYDTLSFYRASSDLLFFHARTVLDFVQSPTRGGKPGQASIEVDISDLSLMQPENISRMVVISENNKSLLTNGHVGYNRAKFGVDTYLSDGHTGDDQVIYTGEVKPKFA